MTLLHSNPAYPLDLRNAPRLRDAAAGQVRCVPFEDLGLDREVRPAHGSILLPLFEEDGLRMGELARRSRFSKQTMTALIRVMEHRKLIQRRRDQIDARASRIYLTPRTRRFKAVAEKILREMEELVEARLTSRRKAQVTAALKTLMNLTREDGS